MDHSAWRISNPPPHSIWSFTFTPTPNQGTLQTLHPLKSSPRNRWRKWTSIHQIFLWPEEHKHVLFLIKEQEAAIDGIWVNMETSFGAHCHPNSQAHSLSQTKYSHTTRIYEEVIRIIKRRFKISVYERSNSSYWSKWFCVLKKDGKSIQIMYDLQPLNVVTIQDLGTPPILEFYADNLSSQGSYTCLDLLLAFDHWSLAIQSQDLMTFQTPLGLLHLTTLPMGVQIMSRSCRVISHSSYKMTCLT